MIMKLIIISVILCMSASAMTLEEAGLVLASSGESKKVESAEKVVKKSGWDALPILNQLMYSGEATVEKRARKLRQWIIFGFSEFQPKEFRERIQTYPSLDIEGKMKLVGEVQKFKPPQPVLMAYLHSRIFQNAEGRDKWEGLKKYSTRAFISVISMECPGVQVFDPRLLHVQTRALLFNQWAKEAKDDKRSNESLKYGSQSYSEWRKLDQSICRYLDGAGVMFEVEFLHQNKREKDALVWLMELENSRAQRQLRREIRGWMNHGSQFPLDALNDKEALGYLMVVFNENKINQTTEDYRKLRKLHPKLSSQLPPRLRILEVLSQLDLGNFYQAFNYAMETRRDSSFRETGLKEVAKWAAKHPERLTLGLPDISELNDAQRRQLHYFINWMAPMESRDSEKERPVSIALFNQLELRSTQKGQWLSLAAEMCRPLLYLYTMAERKQLDDAVVYLTKKPIYAQILLGEVLLSKPSVYKQVKVENHSLKMLQTMISGCWDKADLSYQELCQAEPIAMEWENLRPNLLKKQEGVNMDPLLALRSWNQGFQDKAIQILMNSKRISPYQKASLIAGFLSEKGSVDLDNLFSREKVSTQVLAQTIIRIEDDRRYLSQSLERAVKLSAMLRSRPDYQLGSGFSMYESRKIAYALWLRGEVDLAYRLLEESFWGCLDLEERRLGLFPGVAVVLGRGDEALAKARAMPHKDERYAIKLAYLLNAMGKIDEAFQSASTFPDSKIYERLCIATENWKAALEAAASKAKALKWGDRERVDTLRSWYAYMDGDIKKSRTYFRASGEKSQWMSVLLGDSIKLVDQRMEKNGGGYFVAKIYRGMALDSLLIHRCEEKLWESVNTGEAVPYQTMKTYFSYAEVLPDREKTSRFAYLLSQVKHCDPQLGDAEDWVDWAHKTEAIYVLGRLGATDLLKKLLRQSLGEAVNLSAIPEHHRRRLMLGVIFPSPWSPPSLIKLAQLEWPKKSIAERLVLLTDLFSEPDKIKVAKYFIQLARKHSLQLSKDELIDLLHFSSDVLGQYSLSTKELLAIKGDDVVNKIQLEIRHDRKNLPLKGKRIISPKPGHRSDPRNKDFSIGDGIGKSRMLWNTGHKKQAKQFMLDIVMRVLLDGEDLSSSFSIKIQQGNTRQGLQLDPEAMALVYFSIWEMPEELIGEASQVLTKSPCECLVYDRYKWMAEIADQQDNHLSSLLYSRLYASQWLVGINDSEITHAVALFHDKEATVALEKNQLPKMFFHLRQRMQLAPYQMKKMLYLVRILHDRGDGLTLSQIDKIVVEFWKNRLFRLPGYRPYQKALKEWKVEVRKITQPHHREL